MLPVSTEILHSYYKSCGGVVCTDTRNLQPGCMFFCLHGPRFNGNQFAHKALELGAAAVVVDDTTLCTDSRIHFVADTLQALQDLARFHRHALDTTILAIGGSNGKTTTKELCSLVLGTALKVKATRGNLNNHIGLPLTLLELTGEEDVAVVEMGTNHPGEMKVLCDIACADLGIVTNIGKEHLEGFGDLEAVAKEESELYLALENYGGEALVNTDDPWLANMSKRLHEKRSYGTTGNPDLKGVIRNSMPHLEFDLYYLEEYIGSYKAQIGGAYNLLNMMAAVSAGMALGLDADPCAKAACSYIPGNNRSEWRELNGRSILLDAYNANPSSMELALREFEKIPGSKAVFLGDMLEMGDSSASEHASIFKLCKQLGFDEIYLSGEAFQTAAGNYPLAFANTPALLDWLKAHPPKSGTLLIKGSRGMKMESVLEML
ncbi:MAG: UDP-N-acetylmuramoyl-tripeptide--D-alanyl-D-alanine ligase [Bacteroidetes bacterium]|nr:UDP-N-acetylmuramoyl-tripeptide--D-alanyl-D-alanine ligase [Bacteroidota bacterium]